MTKFKISGLLPAPLYKGRKEEGCGIWLQRVDNGETVFVPSLNKVGDTVPRMTGSAENGYNWRPMYPIEWLQIAAAKDTIETCAAVEECVTNQDDEGKKANKDKLFKISYGVSSYAKGHRGRDDARNSGLFIVDLDGLNTYKPIDIYNQFINGKEKELGIYLVHITPSSRGLRLVAEQHVGESIEQAQVRLLKQLNLGNLIDGHNDKSVHDSCRMSYAVGLFHLLYINPDGLVFKNQSEADRVAALFEYNNHPQTDIKPMQQNDPQPAIVPAAPTVNKPALADRRKFGEYPNDYKGVPFSTIIDAITQKMGRYPVVEGVRNNTVFHLALYLRYICNNDSTWIQQVLPDYGLPKDEWIGCIKSAFNEKYKINEHMPRNLYYALRDLGVAPAYDSSDSQPALSAKDEIIDLEAEEIQVPDDNGNTIKVAPVTYDLDANALPLPQLTRELELLTARYMGTPKERLVVPTIVGSLVIFYTYLTNIRYYYFLDQGEHALNSLTYILGESRGGKGGVFQGLNIIIQPLLDMDGAAKKAWEKYEKDMAKYEAACTHKKGGEKIAKPEKPQIVERILGVGNSVSQACKKMEKAQRQHLFEYSEEIGTFNNALKKEFAASREMYKFAFDNSLYSQDYASQDSWSGHIHVFLNTLFAGTMDFIPALFRSNITDGFTLRSTITTVDENVAGYEGKIDGYSAEAKKELQDICRKFMQEKGFRYCPWIDNTADDFLREKSELAKKTGSKAVYTIAITTAIMGVRAGYYYSISNGSALTDPGDSTGSEAEQNASAFAKWFMEYEWRQHMTYWGDLLEKPVQVPKTSTIYQMLDMVPDEFTTRQLDEICKHTPKYTDNASVLINRWLKKQAIEKVDRGVYRKVVTNQPLANQTLTIAAPETGSETMASDMVTTTQDTAQTTTNTTDIPVAKSVAAQTEVAEPVVTEETSDASVVNANDERLKAAAKDYFEQSFNPRKKYDPLYQMKRYASLMHIS